MEFIARAGIRSLGVSVIYLVDMIVYWQLGAHGGLTTTTRWTLSGFLLIASAVWLGAVHVWLDRKRRTTPSGVTGEDGS
jgi:hypothetical protein